MSGFAISPSTATEGRARSATTAHSRARYIVDVFGADTPLEALTTERIEAWRQDLIQGGRLSRRRIQKAQVMLHAILRRAKKKGWSLATPRKTPTASRSSPPGTSTCSRPRRATRWSGPQPNETDPALYRMALDAGLRMGELRALRWADVDSRAG